MIFDFFLCLNTSLFDYKIIQYYLVSFLYCRLQTEGIIAPNGLRLSRLAGCAGLGSSILRFPRRTYQRRLQPKANSVPTAGWAGLNLLPYHVNFDFFLDALAFFIFCDF